MGFDFLAFKIAEFGGNEGLSELASAVSTKIKENDRVIVFDGGFGIEDNWVEVVIGVVGAFIVVFEGLERIFFEETLAFCKEIVSFNGSVPVVVAVHGVIAADYAG